MALTKDDFIEATQFMRSAKNDLVMTVLVFQKSKLFDGTIKELKETIGDLEVSIKTIEGYIE